MVDPHSTRETIFIRLRADDAVREIAWREFHDRYGLVIANFARRLGALSSDIDDVVQEVILGFYKASPKFEYSPSRGRFRGYLKTCTWRVLRDRFGKQLQLAGRRLDQIDSSDLAIEAAWNDIWEAEKLQRAVDVVRRKYLARPESVKTFEAFEMCVIHALRPDEAARKLAMSVDGVHQARTRVIKAVKAAISELEASEE